MTKLESAMSESYDINKMSDQEIVQAILNRNAIITRDFLYVKCRNLFRSLFEKYYTDCGDWVEFTNEIYLFIMTPQRSRDGKSKLDEFGFRCSFALWLKIVALNYCRQLYAKRADIFEESIDTADRFNYLVMSFNLDLRSVNMLDIQKILDLMPNQRYRTLIKYRYVDEHTNEETAKFLNMNMANFYNKHKLAKAQFISALRKEGLA